MEDSRKPLSSLPSALLSRVDVRNSAAVRLGELKIPGRVHNERATAGVSSRIETAPTIAADMANTDPRRKAA